MSKKKLGEILLEVGLIDRDQLNRGLSYQRRHGGRLGAALLDLRIVGEGILTRALSESLQIPMLDLAKVVIDPKSLRLLRASVCEQHEVFPVAVKPHRGRSTLLLAMADPLNIAAIDELAFVTGLAIRPAIAQRSSLLTAIRKYYYNVPLDIPPLDMSARGSAATAASLPPEGESMTIIGRGGSPDRVVGVDGQVTPAGAPNSISDRRALADREMADSRQRMPPQHTAHPSVTEDPFLSARPETQPAPAAPSHDVPAYMMADAGPDPYRTQPTDAYMVPAPAPAARPPVLDPLEMAEVRSADADMLAGLEQKFWALMRVLASRGLVTREEFMRELAASEEPSSRGPVP